MTAVDDRSDELRDWYAEDDADHDWMVFWAKRDILKHIYQFARSRSVAPYATLGACMRHAVACVEPNVVIPPIIGTAASVNLFTAPVGRSGQGKDGANGAARDAVRFIDGDAEVIDPPDGNIGSGEGLARIFKGTKDGPGRSRADIVVPEVRTLMSLLDRSGATLDGELLKAYMGQPLGFQNNSKDTTTAIPAHSYRLTMSVGVQAENAAFFHQREKDGFPQRFLWLTTIDPTAPRERPEGIEPVEVSIPGFSLDERTGRHEIVVPELVRKEILDLRHLVLIGSPEADPLDSHAALTRLKAAFALAVLDGHAAITEEDWKLAGHLMRMSDRVRESMRDAVAETRRRSNRAKAHDQAEREQIVAERLTEGRQQRVAKAVLSKLSRVKRATRSDLRHTCASDIRSELDPVLEILVEQGQLIMFPGGSRNSDEFELSGE